MKKYSKYGYAILAIPLSILLRYAFVPLIGYGIPYIMLFPATVVVALFAGMGPAVLTGLIGSIITDYFFIPPLHTITFDIPHIARAVVMVLTSIFVGYVGDVLRAGRKRAEEHALALSESESRLKRSQEIAHLGSWELDLANNNLIWSDEVYRIFGLKPQEFGATYDAFLEAVHPDDRTAVNDAYSESLREGRDTYEIEHRIVRKATGEIRYVHEKCQHFRDETGKIIRSIGMVHDITEHKKAEDALVRAKEEWELTFDSVPDLIALIDNHHRILRVNKPMAQRLGLDADKCVGLPCYKYVHGMDGPPEFCPHLGTLKDGCYHAAELHEERLGGDFLVTTNPLFDEQGRLLGSVHVARDITERKAAERELHAERERLSVTLGSIGDGVIATDIETNILFLNGVAEELTGWTLDEAQGKPLMEVFNIINEVTREPAEDPVGKAIKTGVIVGLANHTGLIAKDGTERSIADSCAPIRARDGAIIGAVLVFRDVTERKQAEEEIKKLNEALQLNVAQLEAANKELEAFSYSVSHDLRAPLRSIEGFSKAIMEDYADKLDAAGMDYFLRVTSASRRMTQLIDALLTMSQSTQSEIKEKVVTLSSLVSVIASELKQSQQKRAVEFVIAEKVSAKADPDMIRIVLENLLNNAWKFTSAHAAARIEFGVTRIDDKDVYFVRDDGAGFDMSFADKLFMPFRRFHNESEFPGLGIGLATVRKIINKHGGKIWAESEVGKGATFYFTLDKGI